MRMYVNIDATCCACKNVMLMRISKRRTNLVNNARGYDVMDQWYECQNEYCEMHGLHFKPPTVEMVTNMESKL